MIYGTIKADDMPHPACLVEYGEGGVMAAMFHYASEECDISEIAAEQGYAIEWTELSDGDPLWSDEAVLSKWRPTPPEGWVFGGVSTTDDGPVAIFLRAFAEDQREAVA